MLGDTVSARRHRVAGVAVAPARATRGRANVRTDDADRIVNREYQRDRTPLAGLVEHQLCRSRTAAGQRTEQLESPVILVRRERLPTAFVFIPNAPDPIATAKLGGHESRRFVERNDRRSFCGWIAHGMPDGFGWLARIGRVGLAGAKVEHGSAARHLHPAIRVRGGRSLPGSRQLKDAKARAFAQSYHRPLHTQARFLPQNARASVG